MGLVIEKVGWDGWVAKEQDQKKHKSLYKWDHSRNGYVLLPNVISMPQNLALDLEVFNQNICERWDLSYKHYVYLVTDTKFNIQ